MEPFVFVAVSVCNTSLIIQSVTKQESPKYQPSQNPTYQIDSFEKEKKTKKNIFQSRFFSRRNCVFPRIKLSNSQTLILDGVDIGIFLSDIAQQLRRKKAGVQTLTLL